MRRPTTLSASQSRLGGVSPCVTPSSTSRPRPISPTTMPSIAHPGLADALQDRSHERPRRNTAKYDATVIAETARIGRWQFEGSPGERGRQPPVDTDCARQRRVDRGLTPPLAGKGRKSGSSARHRPAFPASGCAATASPAITTVYGSTLCVSQTLEPITA